MKHKKIIEDMHISMEENQSENRRTYLGMSSSGGFCKRKTFLEFRHAFDSRSSFSSLSHFFDGHASEAIVSQRIIDAGYDLIVESDDGGQYEMQDMYWWRGHCDGLLTIDGEKYVWEHKCSGADKLKKLKKLIELDESTALEKWDDQYYRQAQNYMHYLGINKHILTCSHHGSREILNSKGDLTTAVVETTYNNDTFIENKTEAESIICTDKMPEASWALALDKPLCVWKTGQCEAYDFCKGNHIGTPNCRNCAYVTFTKDGATCEKKGELDEHEMVEFKECHKYHPEFILGFDAVSIDSAGVVYYRNDSGDELINDNSLEFYKEFNNVRLLGGDASV